MMDTKNFLVAAAVILVSVMVGGLMTKIIDGREYCYLYTDMVKTMDRK